MAKVGGHNMAEKFIKIGGNDNGVAKGVKVDRFGEIVPSGANINYLQAINVTLAAGETKEFPLTRPDSTYISVFLTQSAGNKLSVRLRHYLPDALGFGSLKYIEEPVLNQIQYRQHMSDWFELKTTTSVLVATNDGTVTSNSQMAVFGKRKQTGIEYKPKTKILSRIEFSDWGQYNYMTIGKDTITTGALTPSQYLDFTNIKDIKIIIESTLTSDAKLAYIRTQHENYGEVFRTLFADYFSDEVLTIKSGEVFQFGSRESRGLSDVDIFDDLFTNRTSIALNSVGSTIPTGKIKVTILGREF